MNTMTIVFWAIIFFGTVGAVDGSIKMNKACELEVEQGISETARECKQYYFDTKIKSGW
tara:strand:+ start:3537 stop:3713 length:177 start_codon:yes stop_codon:yes gene_type:complete